MQFSMQPYGVREDVASPCVHAPALLVPHCAGLVFVLCTRVLPCTVDSRYNGWQTWSFIRYSGVRK
jgi:hypothetical protein